MRAKLIPELQFSICHLTPHRFGVFAVALADRRVWHQQPPAKAYVGEVSALRCPPLSCRTSPPQGGRLAVIGFAANLQGLNDRQGLRRGGSRDAANLPPCGGDVRQDRGGRCPASLSASLPHRFTSHVVTRSPVAGSLPSLSWMPCARSSSRMRSASAQFFSRMKARRRSIDLSSRFTVRQHRRLQHLICVHEEPPMYAPAHQHECCQRFATLQADPQHSVKSAVAPCRLLALETCSRLTPLRVQSRSDRERSVTFKSSTSAAMNSSIGVQSLIACITVERPRHIDAIRGLLQLAHREIDRLAVVRHQHRQPAAPRPAISARRTSPCSAAR